MAHPFFKILFGDYQAQMHIPPAFARQFGIEAKKYWLEGPRGSVTVCAEKIKGHWYFRGEWARFVEEHSLKDGEILLFQHAGQSTFHVRVYGRHCCEKTVPSTQEGSSVNAAATSSARKSNCENAAIKFAFESECPAFCKVMNKSYVEHGYLSIPAEFYKEHMEGIGVDGAYVSLEMSGKVWDVRLTIPPERTGRLSSGWYIFRGDNLLKVGDACVFQMPDPQQLLLKVTCFRSN